MPINLLIVIVNEEIGCIWFEHLQTVYLMIYFSFFKSFSPKTMNEKSTLTYLGMISTCELCFHRN